MGDRALNRSLFLALSAQFESHCRDLHDEAVQVHVAAATTKRRGSPTLDRLDELEVLLDYRNAIGHGDESRISASGAEGGIAATRKSHQRYRQSLSGLAGAMDEVVSERLGKVLGIEPSW